MVILDEVSILLATAFEELPEEELPPGEAVGESLLSTLVPILGLAVIMGVVKDIGFEGFGGI